MYLCSDYSCMFCGEIENLVNEEVCENCFKTQSSNNNESSEINQITDKIFLGSYYGARNKYKLKSLGITHILICGNRLAPLYPEDFSYCILNIEDSYDQELLIYLNKAFEFIDSSEKIFIHCVAGVSRSPSIVIGYLIYNAKLEFEEAFRLVKSKRYMSTPNKNFIKQLKDFEKGVRSEHNNIY